MLRFSRKLVVGILLTVALSACSGLPRGGALEREILKTRDEPTTDIAVYPVTRAFLPTAKLWPSTGEKPFGWLGGSQGSSAQVVRPGDSLELLVWDTSENSLLTSPSQRVANLPALRVSETGSIFVPYIGKVQVAGRTPDSARAMIQRQIEDIVPSAQVQLSMGEGRGNSIDLVGGVNSPGIIPMPDNNFTVLSAISAGGGVSAGLGHPQIKLVRGSSIYRTSIETLYDNPSLDTLLRGGDKLIVEEDERYFISLGAAGNEAQFTFNRDRVSALDAMALIGGVNDTRADPEGILILREYPDSAVSAGVRGPRKTRVVFTLDLTTSDGLFSARNFPIYSGDLVLATESPLTNTRTIIGLFGSAFGLLNAANAVSN